MSDIADHAAEAKESHRAKLIAQAREQISGAPWQSASAKWCEAAGCGERIPDLRRRAIPGVRFCVECQALKEQQGRRL